MNFFDSVANWKYTIASSTGVGLKALGVEKCNCGPGYAGLSCEVSYWRYIFCSYIP